MVCDNWSMGEPPKLSSDNFRFWKKRMIAFLNCVDKDLLTTITEGPYVPQDLIPGIPAIGDAPAVPERYIDKERRYWSEDDIKKVDLEHKAKHIIVMSIPDDIYHLVIHCETAKEIWDSLVVFFEGNDQVRSTKTWLLLGELDKFTSKPGESITDVYFRFTRLLNDLKEHNKLSVDDYVVYTFLNALPREVSRNLQIMSLHTLYDKLLSHEIRNKFEEENKTDEEY